MLINSNALDPYLQVRIHYFLSLLRYDWSNFYSQWLHKQMLRTIASTLVIDVIANKVHSFNALKSKIFELL